jgi:hypothetical protein
MRLASFVQQGADLLDGVAHLVPLRQPRSPALNPHLTLTQPRTAIT